MAFYRVLIFENRFVIDKYFIYYFMVGVYYFTIFMDVIFIYLRLFFLTY